MIKNTQILSDEKTWLESRAKCVTATEVSALLGLNPFLGPQKILAEKRQSTFVPNAYTIVGQWLEDVVCKASNMTLGTQFEIPAGGGKVFCKHPEIALGATPDAWDNSEPPQLLECKSTRLESFVKYREAPPEYYIIQLATQLLCSESNVGYLSILMTDLSQIGFTLTSPLVIYKLERNLELDNIILDEVNRFWQCVQIKKPFLVNTSTKAKAKRLITKSVEKIHTISNEYMELFVKHRVKIYNGVLANIKPAARTSLEDIFNNE